MNPRPEVFDQWRGQSVDDVLCLCRDTVEEADFSSVQRWREAGGKVVGHFQVYFPRELAHAAGLLPVKVCGAPVEVTEADSRFGSYLCSILKTSIELALSGRVEFDMFVSHPICDAARNLAAIWSRNFDYPSQILYLPQNPNSEGSVPYLQAEYRRLLGDLEKISGKSVTDDELRRSIELHNRSRDLVRELYDLKRDEPWKIAAEDAYVLVAVGGRIPIEEHIELLEWVIEEVRQRQRKSEDRIRVVFEGAFCEQPPLDMIRSIGRTCYVVDDDFLIGLRWIVEDVDTIGDPLTALAEAYVDRSSYSPVQHDDRKRVEAFRMNDKCAAGTGAFLEKTARYMGYSTEEIGSLLDTSRQAVPISGVCAVFAESEVINHLSLGTSPGDIMQGAIESLTKRSVQLMKRIKGKPEYTLIGGILRFSSMQRTVEDQLRAAVNVPSDADCQFACALGAGLLGHIRLAKLKTEGSNRVQPGL